jgi:hypothetical protein
MLVRFLVAVCLVGSFGATATYAVPASPQYGDVPLPQCTIAFERFSHLPLLADTNAVARAIGDSSWASRASIRQVTFMAGWIPMRNSLGPPGAIYEIILSPPLSSHIAGYRIYLHTTRVIPGDAAKGIRAFFSGRSAADIRIDEYSLCFPDNHFLSVDLNSRSITPPLF